MPLKKLVQIFYWPSVMAVLTVIGLTIALLEDGGLEIIGLLGLLLPIVVVLYFYSKSFYTSKPKRERL